MRKSALQVQRVPSDCAIEQISGSYGYQTIDLGTEKLYVHMASVADVEAIVRHRHKLSEDALRPLIQAIVEMVTEKENVLSNKLGLIQTLYCIGDVCSAQTADELFQALSPLALGDITEPTHTMSSAAAANPLNPFKMRSGKPNELRGVALYALACIERDKPGIYGPKLDCIVELALTDIDPIVRTLTYAAARRRRSGHRVGAVRRQRGSGG